MENKIPILFITNKLLIGGAEQVIVNQINLLDKEKFAVYLGLLYTTNKPNNLYFKVKLNNEYIVHFCFNKLFAGRAFWRLVKFLKKKKIAIVFSSLFEANLVSRLAALMAGVKIKIITEQSCYFNKSRWQIWADKFLSYFTDVILGVSEEVIEFTSRQEKISRKKFRLMRQISDLQLAGVFARKFLRQSLGIPENAFVAMTHGRFSPEKAQHRIIKAAEKIIGQGEKGIYFLIVGNGVLEEEMRAEIKAKNLENFVKVIADAKRAKEYLAAGDIFLLTSDREGSPVAMLEAMNAGLFAVASAVGGVPDVLGDGAGGIMVKPGDIGALAEKIVWCRDHKDLLAGKKEIIKEIARKNSGDIRELEAILLDLWRKKAG